MSIEAIKQKMISVGVNLEREEVEYSYALTLINELLDDYVKLTVKPSSLLLNNSFEIENPIIYEREIYIIRFVDLKTKTLDIESIDKRRYKSFIPFNQLTKIVL